MPELSPQQVQALRMRAQGLHPQYPPALLVDPVRAVVGIQAQQSAAMLLALRARVASLTAADLDKAIAGERTLVRSWLMRGTLHLVASEDVYWMNALLAPSFIPKGKGRRTQLGLDDATAAKGLKAIRAILAQESPLNRTQIVERLAAHGVVLDRKTQAPIHLIGLAALEGILLLGPDQPNGETTYVPAETWLRNTPSLSQDEALEQLARRYLNGYAPATAKDFAAWSGLTLTGAKKAWHGLQNELVEVQVESKTLWLPEAPVIPEERELSVRLLPAFDAYLLGYADRGLVVLPAHQPEVYHGGQTVPVVLVDGLAAGTWRYKRQGKRLSITVHPFDDFPPAVRDQIAAEADDIARLWESKAAVSYSTQPL